MQSQLKYIIIIIISICIVFIFINFKEKKAINMRSLKLAFNNLSQVLMVSNNYKLK